MAADTVSLLLRQQRVHHWALGALVLVFVVVFVLHESVGAAARLPASTALRAPPATQRGAREWGSGAYAHDPYGAYDAYGDEFGHTPAARAPAGRQGTPPPPLAVRGAPCGHPHTAANALSAVARVVDALHHVDTPLKKEHNRAELRAKAARNAIATMQETAAVAAARCHTILDHLYSAKVSPYMTRYTATVRALKARTSAESEEGASASGDGASAEVEAMTKKTPPPQNTWLGRTTPPIASEGDDSSECSTGIAREARHGAARARKASELLRTAASDRACEEGVNAIINSDTDLGILLHAALHGDGDGAHAAYTAAMERDAGSGVRKDIIGALHSALNAAGDAVPLDVLQKRSLKELLLDHHTTIFGVRPESAPRATAVAAARRLDDADKDAVLAAVAQNGMALEYADAALKADKDVVLAAVAQRGGALKHAGPALKADKDVVLAAVAQDGNALYYAGPALQADKDVVLTAVAQNSEALQFAGPALKADKDVVLAAAPALDDAVTGASTQDTTGGSTSSHSTIRGTDDPPTDGPPTDITTARQTGGDGATAEAGAKAALYKTLCPNYDALNSAALRLDSSTRATKERGKNLLRLTKDLCFEYPASGTLAESLTERRDANDAPPADAAIRFAPMLQSAERAVFASVIDHAKGAMWHTARVAESVAESGQAVPCENEIARAAAERQSVLKDLRKGAAALLPIAEEMLHDVVASIVASRRYPRQRRAQRDAAEVKMKRAVLDAAEDARKAARATEEEEEEKEEEEEEGGLDPAPVKCLNSFLNCFFVWLFCLVCSRAI